jgi:hypothetical protein
MGHRFVIPECPCRGSILLFLDFPVKPENDRGVVIPDPIGDPVLFLMSGFIPEQSAFLDLAARSRIAPYKTSAFRMIF